ncbi:AAA family ATPase [Actinotalea sp. AC32]|nr:AAA family ATPase [Actinotalea sp. AC32]
MAELVVVTGPPGAGKSTVAAALAERLEPSVLVTGDSFFGFLTRGAIAPWLPEADDQNRVVVAAAAAATGRLLAGGFHAVYDGVVGPWMVRAFVDELGAAVPDLHYVVLLPPLETCLDRVAARTGHGFTDADATRRMHREFAEADVDDRHLLTDATSDVTVLVDRISWRVTDGSLLLRGA